MSTGIAESLNCKVHVSRDKKNVLDCLENEAITRHITLDPHVDGAKVHVVAMKDLNYQVRSRGRVVKKPYSPY